MDDIRHQPPQNPPAGMPADSRTGFPAPKFTGSTAILFCVLSLVPSAVAAAMGEYGFGLFLLSVAAGFSALPLFCGGKYTAAAVIPWVLSAGLSLGLRPERPWFALFVLSFAFLASALAIGGRRRFSRTRLTAVAAGTLARLSCRRLFPLPVPAVRRGRLRGAERLPGRARHAVYRNGAVCE